MTTVMDGPAIRAGTDVSVIAVSTRATECSAYILAMLRAGFVQAYNTGGNPTAGTFGDKGWIKLRGRALRNFTAGDLRAMSPSYEVAVQYGNGDLPVSQERVATLGDVLFGIVSPAGALAADAAEAAGLEVPDVGNWIENWIDRIGEQAKSIADEIKIPLIVGGIALGLIAIAFLVVYLRPWAPGA